MTYYKTSDGSSILMLLDSVGGYFTKLNIVDDATNGITVYHDESLEKAPDEFTEIEQSEYDAIRSDKMLDYWNATASGE